MAPWECPVHPRIRGFIFACKQGDRPPERNLPPLMPAAYPAGLTLAELRHIYGRDYSPDADLSLHFQHLLAQPDDLKFVVLAFPEYTGRNCAYAGNYFETKQNFMHINTGVFREKLPIDLFEKSAGVR